MAKNQILFVLPLKLIIDEFVGSSRIGEFERTTRNGVGREQLKTRKSKQNSIDLKTTYVDVEGVVSSCDELVVGLCKGIKLLELGRRDKNGYSDE